MESLRESSIVSHAALVEAFLLGGLSLAALSRTLQVSPIFDRVDSGLYKLRGKSVSRKEIAQAQQSDGRIPMDLDVEYQATGVIRIGVTLSATMIASGAIASSALPNLQGEWACAIGDEGGTQVTVREGAIAHLQQPYAALSCLPGDRLVLMFDTWSRTVSIAKDNT